MSIPDYPVTNEERYLSRMLGQGFELPDEPITAVERYLDALVQNGGGGGGGGTPVPTGGVTKFNNRTGAVRPANNDYSASMISTSVSGKNVQTVLDELQDAAMIDGALDPSSGKAVENRVVSQALTALEAKTLPPGGSSDDILVKASGNNYHARWANQGNFMKKSDYDTDNNGRVDKADTSYAVQGPVYKAVLRNTRADTSLLTAEDKGVANGVVPLDSNRKILPEYMPDNIMNGLTNGGVFDAQTRVVTLSEAAKSILGVTYDTMTLEDSTVIPAGYPANVELYYITTNPGTFAGMTFANNDWLISLGNQWQQLTNGNQVSSVLGMTGAVTFTSDKVQQGVSNLYMTAGERAKLNDIESQATRDVNVVQNAQTVTLPDGTVVLRLTNKNGTVTDFEGGGAVDLEDYLKKDGNASNTYVVYDRAGNRTAFIGDELTHVFFAKVVAWLNDLETVAFTGRYTDLSNAPTKLSQFTNDGNGNATQPFITRAANDLVNYYKKGELYTRDEINELIDGVSSFNFIQVDTLPTTNIQTNAIYYVPAQGGTGYDRYQYISNRWIFLGSTDIDMSEYLKKNGNASDTTVSYTVPASRETFATGSKTSVIVGNVVKWLSELKDICFSASWKDLEDKDELALKTDLEDYVAIQQEVADAGMVLGIGDDGKVKPVSGGGNPVVKKGGGNYSIVGNSLDSNVASAAYSSAFGQGTAAINQNMFACGRYNWSDPGLMFAVGNGVQGSRSNAFAVDDRGNGYALKEVFSGNNTDNIVEPSASNSLTTKRYVDRAIDEGIANAGLLRSMVVATVPTVDDADGNTLYLVADPTSEGHYLQYKKVLVSTDPDVYEMANLGGTQIAMEGTQVTALPQPSAAFAGKVYQYVGNDSTYIKGANYVCDVRPFYAWLRVGDSNNIYFTEHVPVVSREYVYRGSHGYVGQISALAASGDASTFTDGLGNTYTRMTTEDLSNYYQWKPILTKLSEFTNDGHGTGQVGDVYMTQLEYDSQKPTKTSDLINDGNGTGNVRDTFISKADLLNLIYPIGSIYMSMNSTSPATLFGGTWSQIGDGYYLRASSSGAGNTLDAQLPNVTGSFRFSSGSQGHPEVSSPSGAFKTASNGNLTYPWPTDGTSGGPRTVNFSLKYFNDSLYVDNGTVQPKSLKVYMWQRVADAKPVTGITLSTTDLHIRVGSISRVVVTVNPSDADNPAYTLTVADTSIAAPDGGYGVIRAKKIGTTSVRVKSVSNPEVYADCAITVEPSDWPG